MVRLGRVLSQRSNEPYPKMWSLRWMLIDIRVHMFWHKEYFDKYIESQVVPWGLRIQIFPNIRKVEPDLKIKWVSNLQSCSMTMMWILHDQYDFDNLELDKEIQGWQDDHLTLNSFEGYLNREKRLREHLTKYATELIKTKENKFSRDKKAYDGQHVYKWSQQSTH